jgi:ribonuclease J
MVAVKVDDEVVIMDMGINLEPYIKYTEDEDEVVPDMSANALMKIGAIPDISAIDDWKKKVIAIVPTHAHLDHVGAIPYLASKFPNAPIIGTPFTIEVLKSISENEHIVIRNKIKQLNVNASYKASPSITIEFINMTHSTPQTVAVVLHTKYGKIVYATDFKLDNNPVLGQKTNIKRLRQIGDREVVCLIVDCLNSSEEGKTPSELVAKELLKDVMLGTNSDEKAVIVTTFSSHIARLKSINEFGKSIGRKVMFMGRSLDRYVGAAEACNITKFEDIEICKYRKHIAKALKQITKNKQKYLIVCTGHQGEPQAVLSRIARDEFDFRLAKEDLVIFSCRTIPNPVNEENRAKLETLLREHKARLFKDIHVSGHANKEDLRELVHMLNPQMIIPCHGDKNKTKGLRTLLEEMGFDTEKNFFQMKNGKRMKIKA